MEFDRQEFLTELGKRIKDTRKDRRLSQKGLGELVGKSLDAISTYEAGTRDLSITDLKMLSDALNVPISHLLGDSAVSDEIDLADRVLIPSLRLAAKMTFYRYLKLQYSLGLLLEKQLKDYAPSLNVHEIEDLLWVMRNGLLDEIKRYLDKIAEYYIEVARKYPGVNPLAHEIEPWKIYADDIAELLDEASKNRDRSA